MIGYLSHVCFLFAVYEKKMGKLDFTCDLFKIDLRVSHVFLMSFLHLSNSFA